MVVIYYNHFKFTKLTIIVILSRTKIYHHSKFAELTIIVTLSRTKMTVIFYHHSKFTKLTNSDSIMDKSNSIMSKVKSLIPCLYNVSKS